MLCEQLQERNFKIIVKKSTFLKSSIPYLGNLLSGEGIKPNPVKLEPLKSMPTQDSHEAVRSFLGMAQYYSRFVLSLIHI